MDPLFLKVIISIVPVAVCLAVFRAVDVFHLVPLAEVVELLTAGAVTCIICYFIAGGLIDEFPMRKGVYSQEVAPVLEEALKGVVIVILFAFNRVGYLIDAAIVGFAVGGGFALAENIFYLHQFTDAGLGVWLVRGFGTAVMHGGATAILAVLSQVLFAPRLRMSVDRFHFNPALFLPGLVCAMALHAVFNHFTKTPLAAMTVVLIAVPISILVIFAVGERYAHRWLTNEETAHETLLADIDSGAFAESPGGRAIQRLADRLGPALAPAILDYVRTHTELVVKAEEQLLALEAHEVLSREQRLRDQFRHLHALERKLGRSAVMAVRQHLRFTRNDLWEMHELEESASVSHAR
jgi:RsiW-degrading membrane proteinase PrsW (M82 family)